MTIAHIASVSRSTVGTTSAIDTTGATLIVIGISYYAGGGNNPSTPTDFYGNTYTLFGSSSGTDPRVRLYYAANPTVGSGHTFTVSGSSIFAGICVGSWSGVTTTSPNDLQTNNNGGFGTSLITGSVTPSVSGCLMVTVQGTEFAGNTFTIDTGYTVNAQQAYAGSTSLGCAMAWKEHTSGAIQPTWSWNGGADRSNTHVSFKPSGGGGGGSGNPWYAYAQQ